METKRNTIVAIGSAVFAASSLLLLLESELTLVDLVSRGSCIALGLASCGLFAFRARYRQPAGPAHFLVLTRRHLVGFVVVLAVIGGAAWAEAIFATTALGVVALLILLIGAVGDPEESEVAAEDR